MRNAAWILSACTLFFCVGVNASQDQKSGSKPLAEEQELLVKRYAEFESVLQRMSDLLRTADPERAALLSKVFSQSKKDLVALQLAKASGTLKEEDLNAAIKQQQAALADMAGLLELMLSEDQARKVKERREQMEKYLKDIEKLRSKQKDIRAETERSANRESADPQTKELSDKQGKLSQDTQKLSDQIEKNDGKAKAENQRFNLPQDGQQKLGNPNGDPKAPNDKKGSDKNGADRKEDGKQDDGKSKKPTKETREEKRKNEPGEDEKSDAKKNSSHKKEGDKSGDSQGKQQDGKPQDGKQQDGKPQDGKPQDGKPQDGKPQDGKPQDGKPQDGKPQDGKPQDGKSQDGKPQDGKSQDGKPQDGQPQDGQPSDQQQQNKDDNKQNELPDETPGKKNVENASRKMEEAKKKLNENKKQDASKSQDDAIRELNKAIDELEEILRQLREEERQQRLAGLESRLQRVLEMQKLVLDVTVRLEKTPVGKRTRVDEQKAVDLSRKEETITQEIGQTLLILKEDATAVVMPEVLIQAQSDSLLIVGQLKKADSGDYTQRLEKDVIDALNEIIEALRQEMQKNKEEKDKDKKDKDKQSGEQQNPLLDAIAELKMIRSLQYRVQQRTEYVTKPSADGKSAVADLEKTLADLVDRQARIYDLTRNLVLGKNR